MDEPSKSPPVPRDDEWWARVESLFHEASGHAGPDRERLLAGADAAVRAEVEALLAAAPGADRYFEDLGRRTEALLGTDAPPDLAGRLMGPWRLLRCIGEGGMGVVWLGERADGAFRKEVAVKLLSVALPSAAMRAHFDAERSTLARLEHAGIARLLDGGMASDGTPFLVMEHVEGKRIDEWCDERRLGVAARLRLFLDVCDAVAYAHRNLVVHRDIKPANILVSADGHVKLLDFGVARVLDEEDDAASASTRTGFLALTPSYASPEQLRGQRATTTADVYALGALLHHLLTGRPPRDLTGLGLEEVLRLVRESEPPPASRAASPGAAADRGLTPEQLTRTLRGDLDLILARALHADPERRYPSVVSLRDDIARFLDKRPVSARPDSAWYRAGRMARRRPAVVAAVAVGLFAGTGYTATLRLHADRLEAERNAARVEAEKAEQVTAFLVSLFDAQHYAGIARDSVTAVMLAESARRRLPAAFAGQPLVRATMLAVLGDIQSLLGRDRQGYDLLGEAVAILDSVGAPPDVIADVLTRQGDAARSGRAFDDALDAYTRATGLLEGMRGENRSAVLRIRSAMAHSFANLSQWDKAVALLSLNAADRGEAASTDADYLNDLSILTGALANAGRNEEAEARYRELLEVQREVAEPLHVAATLNRLGLLLARMDRPDEALPLYREAYGIRAEVLGPLHRETEVVKGNLATALEFAGHIAEAGEVLQRRVAIMRDGHPDGSWRVAAALGSMGRFHVRHGQADRGEAYLREAVAEYGRQLGPDHSWTRRAQVELAVALVDQRMYEEAERVLLGAERAGRGQPLEGANRSAHDAVRAAFVRLYEVWGRFAEADLYRDEQRAGDLQSAGS